MRTISFFISLFIVVPFVLSDSLTRPAALSDKRCARKYGWGDFFGCSVGRDDFEAGACGSAGADLNQPSAFFEWPEKIGILPGGGVHACPGEEFVISG